MQDRLRYLLLQIRDPADPIREQEVDCFARGLGCNRKQIAVADLIGELPSAERLARADMILLGGSGNYSATSDAPWLDRTLELLRELHETAKPTFASCWGFQAMARALGGQVIHDPPHAELGTIEMELTEAASSDPVFAPLGPTFFGQAGHEDHVLVLPPGATLLASSRRVENQAYRCDGKPLWCTQFHPELNRADFVARVAAYPQYVERIARVPFEDFLIQCGETPEAEKLLRRMVQHVFG